MYKAVRVLRYLFLCLTSFRFSNHIAIFCIIVWLLDLQLPMQSVHITTKVVSSNPAHGDVYSIQHYVKKSVSDLRQIYGFLWVLRFPPPIKLIARYNWNIVESGVKHYNLNHTRTYLSVNWQEMEGKKLIISTI